MLPYFRLVITGHFFNGLGGPVSNSASPKLSASWFPLEERATATTLGSMALYLGLSVSFVLGTASDSLSVCLSGSVWVYNLPIVCLLRVWHQR